MTLSDGQCTPDQPSGPLAGVRVLDLSRFISGPWCAMLLGDMGADVVKAEPAGIGDEGRAAGPFHHGVSLYFAMYNRNKRSVAVNLRTHKGLEILKKLVAWSDIVVENFRPGVLEQMGISFSQMETIRPGVILVSITGFGQTGPFAERPCFDTIAQAMSGLMDLTGDPEGPPTRVGVYLADFVAGTYGALGALLALAERARKGQGRHIDIAMLDSVTSLMEANFAEYTLTGRMPTRTGNRRAMGAPVDSFRALDGYVFIHASRDSQWKALCDVMGRADLRDDPRFSTRTLRGQHFEIVGKVVSEWVARHNARDVEEALTRVSVPAAVVADVAAAYRNPQVLGRATLAAVDVPGVGSVVMPRNPIRFAQNPLPPLRRAPLLGEHTREILSGLGYADTEIAQLAAEGVVAVTS